MIEEPSEKGKGPEPRGEYQVLCKYQAGPFKTETKIQKLKLEKIE